MTPDKPWVWVVGGGLLQLPIIMEFKQRGYAVLVTDGKLDCAANTTGYADAVVQLDTYDWHGHLLQAEGMATRPVAVVTDAADVGPTVSLLAEYYGLPACSFDAARKAQNKGAMRQALELPHPAYRACPIKDNTNIGNAVFLWERHASGQNIEAYPCVVKPVDNCASRGISKCYDEHQLWRAIETALYANKNANTVVIEECLTGQEVATDWFVRNGKVEFVNGAERVFAGLVELGHLNPVLEVPLKMLQLAQYAAEQLGVKQGPFKIDFMQDTKYGWCILETATRWSGGFDHTHTMPLATGKNTVKALADYALGQYVSPAHWQAKWRKHAAAYAPMLPVGKQLLPRHIRQVEQMPDVIEVIVRDWGTTQSVKDCAGRPLFIITHHEERTRAWEAALEAGERLAGLLNA